MKAIGSIVATFVILTTTQALPATAQDAVAFEKFIAKADSLLRNGRNAEAITFYVAALDEAERAGESAWMVDTLKKLSEAYRAVGDISKATACSHRAISIKSRSTVPDFAKPLMGRDSAVIQSDTRSNQPNMVLMQSGLFQGRSNAAVAQTTTSPGAKPSVQGQATNPAARAPARQIENLSAGPRVQAAQTNNPAIAEVPAHQPEDPASVKKAQAAQPFGQAAKRAQGDSPDESSTEAALNHYLSAMQKRIKDLWHPPKGQQGIKVVLSFTVDGTSGNISNLKLTNPAEMKPQITLRWKQ